MKIAYTDLEVINMIKSGDAIKEEKALTFMYRSFYADLDRWLLKKGMPDLVETKDIFQYGIITLYNKIKTQDFALTKNASIKTLLYAICGNRWKNEWRTMSRKQKLEAKVELEEVDEQTALQDIIASERTELLCQLVNELGERCKKLLFYVYQDKLKHDKIIEKMGFKNTQLSRNALFKCRKKLAAKIIGHPLREKVLRFK